MQARFAAQKHSAADGGGTDRNDTCVSVQQLADPSDGARRFAVASSWPTSEQQFDRFWAVLRGLNLVQRTQSIDDFE